MSKLRVIQVAASGWDLVRAAALERLRVKAGRAAERTLP